MIDREAALKKAEKLLRQGKLKEVIEEYVRLIVDQPRDVGALNALGDRYIRAGDGNRAVAQFTRVADQLFADGFLLKPRPSTRRRSRSSPITNTRCRSWRTSQIERAADGRAETREEAFAVPYELADMLERLGEPARALAILVDLEADAGEYRDVRKRIEHVVRAQGGSQQA